MKIINGHRLCDQEDYKGTPHGIAYQDKGPQGFTYDPTGAMDGDGGALRGDP